MADYDKSTGTSGTLRIRVTYSQSIANNTTTITTTLILLKSNPATYFSNTSWSANFAGMARSGSVSMSQSNTSKTIGTWAVTKTHASDGTLSAANRTISFTLGATGTGGMGGPTTHSVTLSIPTIPRASTISSSTSSVSITGSAAVSVSISRASTSFTHDVKFTLGSASYTATGVATSTSYTIPTSWRNQMPSSTSRVGTITVTTKNGSTTIGTTSKSFTATIPTNVIPSAGTLTVTRPTPLPTGFTSGMYVQGKSSAQAVVSGSAGVYGSTITSTSVTIGNITKSGTDVTIPLEDYGTVAVTATVTDSRGRKATATQNITVTQHDPLAITALSITRGDWNGGVNDNGTFAVIYPTYVFTPHGRINTVTASARYRLISSSTWTNAGTVSLNNGYAVIGGGNLSPDNTYEIEFTLSDEFDSIVSYSELGTSFVTMDFLSGGRGMAIGKVSEGEGLEIDFDTKINKPTQFLDTVDVAGATTFGDSVDFGGLVRFTEIPPVFEIQRGSDTITATSWAEFNITVGNPVNITLAKPTWYRLSYRAWIYITGGIGEHRIGISLSGATSKSPSAPTWGDVLRQTNVGAGTRDELNIDYLLNAGTTSVKVEGYKIGSVVHTVNYQLFRANPIYPGAMA